MGAAVMEDLPPEYRALTDRVFAYLFGFDDNQRRYAIHLLEDGIQTAASTLPEEIDEMNRRMIEAGPGEADTEQEMMISTVHKDLTFAINIGRTLPERDRRELAASLRYASILIEKNQ